MKYEEWQKFQCSSIQTYTQNDYQLPNVFLVDYEMEMHLVNSIHIHLINS